MESNLYLEVQLRMGKWIDAGLWMPIDDINMGYSRDLLNHLLGRKVHRGGGMQRFAPMTEAEAEICKRMLSAHGYTYFRMLLEQKGPMPDAK